MKLKEILISAHNPVTGPRHLGHYVSSIKELKHLQDKYECFILFDDLLAYFMYPNDRVNIMNRSFTVSKIF